jgi:hypothetical protein
MLVFDRMARGLRLSIALEAKLARERRWDADEMMREAQGERHAPRWRRAATPSAATNRDAEPRETDREQDDDGLPADAPLVHRIDRLKTILDGGDAPEPAVPRVKFEWRAGADPVADAPDVLTPADQADVDAPPWRGSG